MKRDPNHPFAFLVSHEELRFARDVARALRLESGGGYDGRDDTSWLRISHSDLHLLLRAHGECPADGGDGS